VSLRAVAAGGFEAVLFENKRKYYFPSWKKSRGSEWGICLSALLGTV